MRRKPRFLLIMIIVLTVVAVSFNLPKKTFPVSFTTPAIPFLDKKLVVKKVVGLDAGSILQSFGIQRNYDFKKGLDLEGGTSITLKADMKDVPAAQRDSALESAKNVIERRVNFFGVSEPVVQTAKVAGDYRIVAEIPGVTDVTQAVNLIGQTAKLTFWEQGASPSAKIASESAAALPLGLVQYLGAGPKKTDLSGNDLKQSQVSFDSNTGQPDVQLVFTSAGAKKFAAITTRNVNKPLAMVLDNYVIEAPTVSGPITQGNAVINGSFTTEQAKQLAVQLNAGALPVELSVLEQRAIGATLGNESLQKSAVAGVIGFAVIVIFMIVLYGRLGVIASVALALYTLLVLTLFRLIPVTLTLAGIAGLILSIGIAVDANILIFERMKEEMRKGKPKHIALELGFTRAWDSIRDSNVASLITSLVLYLNGSGAVRGFALTLAVGVLVSLFSAITVTRTLMRYFYR
jgi:preprotein translocase subunit SecD